MTELPRRNSFDVSPVTRLGVGLIVGSAAGLAGPWHSILTAIVVAWGAAALVFVGWTWIAIWPMDGPETRGHALREEPTRAGSEAVLVAAGLLSLVGVVAILVNKGAQTWIDLTVTLGAVVASWLAIHTVFALRYARLFFCGGGIDFHQSDGPRYSDFAYLAFAVGMSFAISDTDLSSSSLRQHVLRHALLSYLFGSAIIALVINLTAGLF